MWTIYIILVIWLVGLINGVGGQYTHLLLIVAGAAVIFNLIRSRQAAF